jgi:hypothetical protein
LKNRFLICHSIHLAKFYNMVYLVSQFWHSHFFRQGPFINIFIFFFRSALFSKENSTSFHYRHSHFVIVLILLWRTTIFFQILKFLNPMIHCVSNKHVSTEIVKKNVIVISRTTMNRKKTHQSLRNISSQILVRNWWQKINNVVCIYQNSHKREFHNIFDSKRLTSMNVLSSTLEWLFKRFHIKFWRSNKDDEYQHRWSEWNQICTEIQPQVFRHFHATMK